MGIAANWRYFAKMFKSIKEGLSRENEPLSYRSWYGDDVVRSLLLASFNNSYVEGSTKLLSLLDLLHNLI
jgi:hypothetical protein